MNASCLAAVAATLALACPLTAQWPPIITPQSTQKNKQDAGRKNKDAGRQEPGKQEPRKQKPGKQGPGKHAGNQHAGQTGGPSVSEQQPQDEAPEKMTDAYLTRNYDDTQDAGITWKDLTKSGGSIRLYGFARLDYYYQTARANSVIIPAWVLPENGAIHTNDSDNAFDARLTRIGLEIGGTKVGSAEVSGKIETDFANFPDGTSESRETPRIRLAYIDVDFDESDWMLRFGQDWDVASPLYPAVHAELLLWYAGNTGDRRPMAQAIWNHKAESGTEYKFTFAAGLTGAVDNQNLDPASADPLEVPERDGFDSGMPGFQTRFGITTDSWVEGRRATLGAWGFWGRLETDISFGGERNFDTWMAGGDWTVPLTETLTWRGEAWAGQALTDFRGNIGHTINPTSGDEIKGWGGFSELWWQATDKVRLHFGGSIDDNDNDDLVAGFRSLNWTGYGGTLITWHPRFKTGFDVLYWDTNWVGRGDGDMVRFNAYVMYTF